MQKSKRKLNKKEKLIYLDYASSAPVDPKVFSLIANSLRRDYANPSAIHKSGLNSKNKITKSRKEIAGILKANSDEIFFTSGGTESNNLAILGVLENHKKPHVIISNIEHSSIIELCKNLENKKIAEITFLEVEDTGLIDPKKVKKVLRDNTVLVSVMYANNEIGTIQPIKEIVKEIRHFNKINKKNILFHTDATQAMNYLSTNLEKLGVDMMTFNGSKIYGPRGTGVLYKKRKISLRKVFFGGSQEAGLRPGTENLPNIVGLAKALSITEEMKEKESRRLIKLRDYLLKEILKISKKIVINGDLINRLPNNLNITIPNIPSDLLVIELSERGIEVSSKSACKSGDDKASYVIKAINKNLKEEDGSIRISLGRYTEKEDIKYFIKSLKEILKKLGKWYN